MQNESLRRLDARSPTGRAGVRDLGARKGLARPKLLSHVFQNWFSGPCPESPNPCLPQRAEQRKDGFAALKTNSKNTTPKPLPTLPEGRAATGRLRGVGPFLRPTRLSRTTSPPFHSHRAASWRRRQAVVSYDTNILKLILFARILTSILPWFRGSCLRTHR